MLPARFDPAGDGETVPIVTMQGDMVDTPAAGRLHIRLHGAGRFLTVEPPVDGAATVDFHRLRHPPCAHSPFATCPLPPLENRLPFVVRASERTP